MTMADLASLREARRRRILNNSENRLKYIAGQEFELETKDEPITSSTTPLESDLEIQGDNVPELLQEAPYQIFDDPEIETLTSLPPPRTQEFQAPIKPMPFFTYKVDILLASLLIQILYNTSILNYNVNLFLPLLIFSATKLFLLPTKSQTGIVSAILVMNGITPQKVETILNCVYIIKEVTEDMFVFLFFTIFVQTLFFMKS